MSYNAIKSKCGRYEIEPMRIYGENSCKRIDNDKPTFIGRRGGFSFYEHPRLGDESALLVKGLCNGWVLSEFWELPDTDDLKCLPAAMVNRLNELYN